MALCCLYMIIINYILHKSNNILFKIKLNVLKNFFSFLFRLISLKNLFSFIKKEVKSAELRKI